MSELEPWQKALLHHEHKGNIEDDAEVWTGAEIGGITKLGDTVVIEVEAGTCYKFMKIYF